VLASRSTLRATIQKKEEHATTLLFPQSYIREKKIKAQPKKKGEANPSRSWPLLQRISGFPPKFRRDTRQWEIQLESKSAEGCSTYSLYKEEERRVRVKQATDL
jgi:hypothetical protein